jgi:hypothetical protein
MAMLCTIAFVSSGHVLATVLAAIHALVPGRLAHLRMLLMLHLRIGGSRNGRLSGGSGCRCDQRHHMKSPEFESSKFWISGELGRGCGRFGMQPIKPRNYWGHG